MRRVEGSTIGVPFLGQPPKLGSPRAALFPEVWRCRSIEIDTSFDGPKIELNIVVRCKGSEVEFARLVQFAERILIVHR
jgi:hypothetical protein